MVKTLDELGKQLSSLRDDWLICDRADQFPQLLKQFNLELAKYSHCQTPPKIILAESEPVRFLAGFIAACIAKFPVFLCNPNWVEQEWQQVLEQVQPDIVWGVEIVEEVRRQKIPTEVAKDLQKNISLFSSSAQIMIPTGGSSGKIKFAIHTWETLTASVRGFTKYFNLKQVNFYCVLPLYHVSGLMQFIRCFTTGAKLVILPFKKLESGQLPDIEIQDFFISLVPTQLHRLLQNRDLTTWLSKFQTVLLGGAPAWGELLEKARYYQIPLALTYGMTETASQIATLKPDDFFNGKVNCGQVLPHAKVIVQNQQGETLKFNQLGNITIQADSLTLGYYPCDDFFSPSPIFKTDDLGFLDEAGYLNIVGRSSDKIITGGENAYPSEIESAIRSTNMVVDVCVIGVPDQNWGQAVTAIYIPKNPDILAVEIQNLLKVKLSKFKIPKYWVPVESLPRNSQGKINRQKLEQVATEYLHHI